MTRATTALLLLTVAVATAAAIDGKDAKAIPTPSKPEALKASAIDALPSNQSVSNRALLVTGRSRYSLWINMTEVIAAIVPIVRNETAGAAAITPSDDAARIPDEHAKSEAHAIFDKVMAVLQKYKAEAISVPKSFASSPVFAPNSTAFKMLIANQKQKFEAQRRAMAERWGRHQLVQGRPMIGSPFGLKRLHRERLSDPMNPNVQIDGQQKDAAPIAGKENATKAEAEKALPMPDPKTLVNFKGFRFYQPLRFVVPTEVVNDITHALSALNTTVIAIKPYVSAAVLDEARRFATAEAVKHALATADAALNVAGVKRLSVENMVIRSSPNPRFAMRSATNFIPPQHFAVTSEVALSVKF